MRKITPKMPWTRSGGTPFTRLSGMNFRRSETTHLPTLAEAPGNALCQTDQDASPFTDTFMPFEFSIAYDKFYQFIEGAIRLLPNLVIGLLVLLVFFFAARVIRKFIQRTSEARRHRNLAIALSRLAQWTILLMGVLVAATIVFPNFTPADLIGALGLTGIAIGFAFRDIFENFLAGILILVTEPFRIDDQIIIEGYEGTVENIETRATTIVTYDGRRVVIPNSKLFKSSVIINTAFDRRRLEYDITIGNGDSIALAKKIMLETVLSVNGVLAEPVPDALVFAYSDSGVTIRLRWWINPPRRADVLAAQDAVLERVKAVLTEHGIDLPYPTQQILFHDQTEETDGDRSRQREGWPAGKQDEVIPRPRVMTHAHAINDALRPQGASAQSLPDAKKASQRGM